MQLTNSQARAAYIAGSEIFFCESGWERIGFRRHLNEDSDHKAGLWFDELVKRFIKGMTAPAEIVYEVD